MIPSYAVDTGLAMLIESFDDLALADVPYEGTVSRGGGGDTVEVRRGPGQGVDHSFIARGAVYLQE